MVPTLTPVAQGQDIARRGVVDRPFLEERKGSTFCKGFNPRPVGVGLSGGLIGPPGLVRNDVGSIGGTRVFLRCSDVDPHIPRYRLANMSADAGKTSSGEPRCSRLDASCARRIWEYSVPWAWEKYACCPDHASGC
jgi:hypothetical protein